MCRHAGQQQLAPAAEAAPCRELKRLLAAAVAALRIAPERRDQLILNPAVNASCRSAGAFEGVGQHACLMMERLPCILASHPRHCALLGHHHTLCNMRMSQRPCAFHKGPRA